MTYRIWIPSLKRTFWAKKPKGRKTWWKVQYPSACGKFLYQSEHGGTVTDMKRDVLKEHPDAVITKCR